MEHRQAQPRRNTLAPRQERFVGEYLIDLNGQEAAVRAGYSPRTARVTASQLLTKPNIARAIADAKATRAERTQLNADRTLLEIARIAFANIGAFFDERGRLRRPNELSEEAAAALASINVVTRERGGGTVEHVHRIRILDKVRALELLAKHLGLFAGHVKVEDVSYDERVKHLSDEQLEKLAELGAQAKAILNES